MGVEKRNNEENKNVNEGMTEWLKVADCKSVRIFLT